MADPARLVHGTGCWKCHRSDGLLFGGIGTNPARPVSLRRVSRGAFAGFADDREKLGSQAGRDGNR